MSLVVGVLVIALVALTGRWYIKRKKFVKCLKNIPGPPPLPIIGNALDWSSAKKLLAALYVYPKKYGGIVKVHIGSYPNFILVSDYKFLEFLMKSTEIVNKAAEYRFLHSWLGTGVFLSDATEKWKLHKKIITSAFGFQILEKFIDVFESNSKTLVEKLKGVIGESSVDIYPFMSSLTLDIICESAMGTSVHAQKCTESDYVKSVKGMSRIFMERFFNPLLQTKFPYILSMQYRAEKKYIKFLHDHTNSVIKSKREAFQNVETFTKPRSDDLGRKRRLALLDLLLEETRIGHKFSDLDLQQEIDTFMLAGHDPPTSTLSFILYCLAQHQQVQQMVVTELESILSEDKFRNLTMKDFQDMKYLEAVIKETLRFYPTAPFVGRLVKKDIEYNGTILPEGLGILVNIAAAHRNPDIFPDPEMYRPERFYNGNFATKFPFGFIPFSAGMRGCMGQKFAMLEMKVVVINVLRNFEVLPAYPKHNMELVSETVLKSDNGICIQLKQRKF